MCHDAWSAKHFICKKPREKKQSAKLRRQCKNITVEEIENFDTHGSVHRRLLSRNTTKLQLCNRIYYSKAFQRLNMFRAAHRSSSGVLNCICSFWFICPYGDRPLPRLSGHSLPTQPWQWPVTLWAYKPEAANTV